MSEDAQKPNRPTVESMVYKMFRYQQRQKYWKIAKFCFIAFLVISIGLGVIRQVNQSVSQLTKGSVASAKLLEKEHIALVEFRGPVLGSFDTTVSSTADVLVPALRRAFKNPKTVTVVLRINSPGGSPMQSDEIYNEIHHLREQYPKIPIYAVCEELCASGAYYIASACNAIYANPHSQVGSLGVIFASNGYSELMKKLGVERRLVTTGANKGMLDPYSPLREEDVKILKEMLNKTHELFIDAVKKGRGDRLKEVEKNQKELFSGRIWIGSQALELGLIDGFANIDTIARELKVYIVDYTPQPDWLAQFRRAAGIKMSVASSQYEALTKIAEPLLEGKIANIQ